MAAADNIICERCRYQHIGTGEIMDNHSPEVVTEQLVQTFPPPPIVSGNQNH